MPRVYGPLSAKHKAKLSVAHKGQTSWNKGRKMPAEFGAKVSAAQRGRPGRTRSAEELATFSAARKGHPVSPETRAKIRAALLGRVVPAEALTKRSQTTKGRKQSPEVAARRGAAIATHGHTRGHQQSSTYKSWQAMLQRCTNPNRDNWPYYGGAGIAVCPEWRTFGPFLADMGPRPVGTTLDRKDGTKGYFPQNCRWAPKDVQIANRRPQRKKAAEPIADGSGCPSGRAVGKEPDFGSPNQP